MKHRAIYVGIGVALGVLITFAFTVRAEKETERVLEEPEVVEQIVEEPKVVLIEIEYTRESIERKIRETFHEEPERALAIAQCESGLNPDALNTANKNGTSDGGLFQINSVHDKRLNALGLDKFDVEDNIAFARMLYEERGWTPWVCDRLI
jgi:hypothetical protein